MRNQNIPIFEHIDQGDFCFWQSLHSSLYSLASVAHPKTSPENAVHTWDVEPLIFTRSTHQSLVLQRNKWHVEDTGEQIFLHRYVEGRAIGHVGGAAFDHRPGPALLIDYSKQMEAVLSNCVVEGVFVPYEAVNFDPELSRSLISLDPETALGRLIHAEMTHMFNVLQQGSQAISPASIQRFLGCVSFALSPHAAAAEARISAHLNLRDNIIDHIEANLQSHALSVESILANFGTSRASLYRMFDGESGVRNYITRRRLFRAIMDIAQNPMRRGQIHEAAERWAFSSDANFNRAVKRHFGVSPGAMFEAPIEHHPKPLATSRTRELLSRTAQRAA